MFKHYLKFLILSLVASVFFACSDDDDGVDYPFDREAMDISVLRSCGTKAEGRDSCYRVRFRYPFLTERLDSVFIWLDTTVVDDTSKSVSASQRSKATYSYKYSSTRESVYDTIDLTSKVMTFRDSCKTLQIALFCKYSKGDPGSVQRILLHLGDDMPPALISLRDSSWTTGTLLTWYRPTDQIDFYSPENISGPIVGYNFAIEADNKDEDIRKAIVTLKGGDGKVIRNARIRFVHDSIRVDSSLSSDDKKKNKLYLTVLDSKGFDTEVDSVNRFRLLVDGLKTMSSYSVSVTSWDSSGNYSEVSEPFYTTDSIAPLMPKSLVTIEDSLYAGTNYAVLDSNNRLRIFWSRAVDPLVLDHGIKEDSVLVIPSNCASSLCYDSVAYYEILRYNPLTDSWDSVAGGDAAHFIDSYDLEKGEMVDDPEGRFVVDTIRWVSPGDTLIIRIRARDASGYYSKPLLDTVYVSPGALAKEMECPEGFVAVAASDTNKFCMEKFEHRNDSGEFVRNVLHSEAVAACEAVSASGFKVSLCKERDWELVCLSNGKLSYGVVEDGVEASSYLFSSCNVATNDSLSASDIAKRHRECVNPMGVRDMPGQYQEWALGRSEDTLAVLKGSSYMPFGGLDKETFAQCTNRSFPYYTRPEYTTDTVYLYREGTMVDTVFAADTSRTLYAVLTLDNPDEEYRFSDTLQFFNVLDSSGNKIGVDYTLYSEYKNGGDEWVEGLANGLVYEPDHIEVVFIKKETRAYREAASFYKSPSIGFRCCAYPE